MEIPVKAHDLPPLIVRGRYTDPIKIETMNPENLPIDDVLQFEVSELPDIMNIGDVATCLFPPLHVSGPRIISSKFFPSREIFWQQTQEIFQKRKIFF